MCIDLYTCSFTFYMTYILAIGVLYIVPNSCCWEGAPLGSNSQPFFSRIWSISIDGRIWGPLTSSQCQFPRGQEHHNSKSFQCDANPGFFTIDKSIGMF